MPNEEIHRLETDHHLPDHRADSHRWLHGLAKLPLIIALCLMLMA